MSLLQLILEELPFDKQELASLIATAPRRYKTYQIPKRDGKTFRTIAQPASEVKILQKLMIDRVVAHWPVHESATAYRTGASIADHVRRHINSRYLLKLDFSNFFPSITAADLRQHAAANSKLEPADIAMLVNILAWRNKLNGQFCLSIGAPSSPHVSNSIMYEFDKKLTEICAKRDVTYSRYADDLAFSTNRRDTLKEIEIEIKHVLKELTYPHLTLNEKKTINVSKRYNRTLVGLTITPDGKVSLGRDRKRQISAQLHRFSQGYLKGEEISQLRGVLAYAWSVEPEFVLRLIEKQGNEVFEKIGLPFRKKES